MKGHLLFVLALAIFARPSLGTIDITLFSAPEGAITPGTHKILEAYIQSTAAIDSVSAELGSLQFDLERTSGSENNGSFISTWRRVFTVPELPDGPTNLITSVIASNNETAVTNRSVIIASPPSLIIDEIFDGYVLHSGRRLPVKVTAFDEDSEVLITVTTPDFSFVRTNQIDLPIILSRSYNMRFSATGNHSQTTNKSIQIFVQANPKFEPIASVPGTIWDADSTRILYQRDSALRINLIGGESNGPVLFQSTNQWAITNALLTPGGALIVERRGSENNYRIFEANEADITYLGPTRSEKVQLGANYAAWIGATNELIWRDLVSGTTVVITNDLSTDAHPFSLAENGDVSFSQSDRIFRYRAGSIEQISTNLGVSSWTDGTNILYTQERFNMPGSHPIYLYTPGGTLLLGSGNGFFRTPFLNSGWAVFFNQGQQFIRTPSGSLQQRGGNVLALNSQGELLLRVPGNQGDTYAISKPDSSVINFGTFEGRFIYRDDHWDGVLGNTLFRVRENSTNLMLLHQENGVLSLNFIGTPGNTYQIQITGDLNQPVTWTPLRAPMTADINGSIGFLETAPPTNRIYRAVQTQP